MTEMDLLEKTIHTRYATWQAKGLCGFRTEGAALRWAIQQGMNPGDIITRKDLKLPFSPDNCEIHPLQKESELNWTVDLRDSINRYDATVAMLRDNLRKARYIDIQRTVIAVKSGKLWPKNPYYEKGEDDEDDYAY